MEGFTSPGPDKDKQKFCWMDLRSMIRGRELFTSKVNVDAVRQGFG